MIGVQRIIAPDTGQRSWVLFDDSRVPIVAPNQYLAYLHCLGRSPNTVRACKSQTINNDCSVHTSTEPTLVEHLASFCSV